MAFLYRRNMLGDAVQPLKLLKLASSYAPNAKRWDVVKFDSNGEVVAAADGDTEVLGVLETVEMKAQGETDTYGSVRANAAAIYEAPVTGGTPAVGASYGFKATDGGTVNVADTTSTCVKVVAIRPNGNVDVVITGSQLA